MNNVIMYYIHVDKIIIHVVCIAVYNGILSCKTSCDTLQNNVLSN